MPSPNRKSVFVVLPLRASLAGRSLVTFIALLGGGFSPANAVEPGRYKFDRGDDTTRMSDIHDGIEAVGQFYSPHVYKGTQSKVVHVEERNPQRLEFAKFWGEDQNQISPTEYSNDFLTEGKLNTFMEFSRRKERKAGSKSAKSGKKPPQSPWKPGFRKPQRDCCGSGVDMGDCCGDGVDTGDCCTEARMPAGSTESAVDDEIDEPEFDDIQEATSISVGVEGLAVGSRYVDWVGPPHPNKGDKLMLDIDEAKRQCHEWFKKHEQHCVVAVAARVIDFWTGRWKALTDVAPTVVPVESPYDAWYDFKKTRDHHWIYYRLSYTWYMCVRIKHLLKNQKTMLANAFNRKKKLEKIRDRYKDDITKIKEKMEHDSSDSSNVVAQYEALKVDDEACIGKDHDDINDWYRSKLKEPRNYVERMSQDWVDTQFAMERAWFHKEDTCLEAAIAASGKKREDLDAKNLPYKRAYIIVEEKGNASEDTNSGFNAELVARASVFAALQEESRRNLTPKNRTWEWRGVPDLISKDVAWDKLTWKDWVEIYKNKQEYMDSYLSDRKFYVSLVCSSVAFIFLCGCIGNLCGVCFPSLWNLLGGSVETQESPSNAGQYEYTGEISQQCCIDQKSQNLQGAMFGCFALFAVVVGVIWGYIVYMIMMMDLVTAGEYTKEKFKNSLQDFEGTWIYAMLYVVTVGCAVLLGLATFIHQASIALGGVLWLNFCIWFTGLVVLVCCATGANLCSDTGVLEKVTSNWMLSHGEEEM